MQLGSDTEIKQSHPGFPLGGTIYWQKGYISYSIHFVSGWSFRTSFNSF